jgi:plasmid stabilization system protein ParE
MPTLAFTSQAKDGLARCRGFLREKNPLAAQRAAEAIRRHLQLLTRHPEAGRPFDDMPQLRELLIPFGDTGYVALYRHIPARDLIVLLAFRHQKETGY